uniref:Uncharacterized protein n=1 Tax=Arundo donax TaxID=35708 RepID=A0A0A9BX14_ARUDO
MPWTARPAARRSPMGTRTPGGARSRKRSPKSGPAQLAVAAAATAATTTTTEAAGTPPVAPPPLATLVLITDEWCVPVSGGSPETASCRRYSL